MKLVFSQSALRQLARLDQDARKRIVGKLEFFCSQKQPLNFAEKLTDSRYGEWRFRIGPYRAIFDLKNDTVVVLVVGDRKDIYK